MRNMNLAESLNSLNNEFQRPKPIGSAESFIQIRQKYKNQMLFELCMSGKLLHVTLANRLGISASGLNAVIKKLSDSDMQPLEETKSGKFKFYRLSESGKEYVKEEILPGLIKDGQSEDVLQKVYDLLAAYKDNNQGKWEDGLKEIVEADDGKTEEDDLNRAIGIQFLKEFFSVFKQNKESAEALLNLVISDKELNKQIIERSERQNIERTQNVMTAMNLMFHENCKLVYRLVDMTFESLSEEESWKLDSGTTLSDSDEWWGPVQNKILADVLRALAHGLDKDRLAEKWIQEDMSEHLAMYLAEKYRLFRDSFSKMG